MSNLEGRMYTPLKIMLPEAPTVLNNIDNPEDSKSPLHSIHHTPTTSYLDNGQLTATPNTYTLQLKEKKRKEKSHINKRISSF